MAATQTLPSNGEQNEMIDTLNRRLAQRVRVARATQREPAESPEPLRSPTVLELIDVAIGNLPGSDAAWSVIARYSATDIKDKVFKARENLCMLRSLLIDAD